MALPWIEPEWPAPAGIRAASTLRAGGVSLGPYASLNLGGHVGDDDWRVGENRSRLAASLNLPAEPLWLNQGHGTRTVVAEPPLPQPSPRENGYERESARPTALPGDNPMLPADAACTRSPGVVCAIMTADCLPILLCSRDGTAIAAVHAGWKGLAGGIVESAVEALGTLELIAWLGPAIGPEAFEVRTEVRDAFLRNGPEFTEGFRASSSGKWRADLYRLARITLVQLKITEIYGGGWCTFGQPEDFFSYRREGTTGRMATLIWRE